MQAHPYTIGVSGGDDDAPQSRRAARVWELLLIALVLAAALVPFVNRALHLDDPFYVWVAQHIAQHPLDFYGFSLNWNGHVETVHEINKNPPGISYYLALFGSLFGWREPVYHVGLMLLAIATAIGVYAVAQKFTRHALPAVMILAFTPVFLLSATNVMAEMGMLMLYVWGLYFWIRGIKEDRVSLLIIAGAFAGLSALTKYYGLSAIPLFLVYGFAEKRRTGLWVLAVLVPVAILAAYELYTAHLYGRGHIVESIVFAEESNLRKLPMHLRTLIGLAFIGGCTLPVAFYAAFLWGWRVPAALGVFILGATVFLHAGFQDNLFAIEPELGAGRAWYAFQLAVCVGAGIHLFLLGARDLYRRRDALSLLLFLWLVGTFVFAVRFNWAVNGRSLLAAAVPAALYVARAWELRGLTAGKLNWRMYAPLIPGACIALVVTYADYSQANAYRTAAHSIAKNFGVSRNTLWFQGHWGFQYYMEQIGGKHTETTGIDVTDGDFLITPYYNTAAHDLHISIVHTQWQMDIQPFRWATTWNPQAGAGYYADSWGPLPFVFTRVPPEQFLVVRLGFTGRIEVGGQRGSPLPQSGPE